jgi:DNA mismatch repair protein MutS2
MKRRGPLQILEFDKILDAMAGYSHCEASHEYILSLVPLRRKEDIEIRFGQVQEIRRLSQERASLGFSRFQNISPLLESIRPEGSLLEPLELLSLLTVLQIIAAVSSQVRERKDLPLLHVLTESLTGFPGILSAIEKTVDWEGRILDSASPELFDLRADIRRLEVRIRKRLEEMVRDRRMVPLLQDNFIVQRSGRWVIPVRMDSKGRVPGVVHDVSRSGETAFIEPLEIIGISNELENLIAEEKGEVLRILRAICGEIRKVVEEIRRQYETIVYVDVLNSIACFSDFLQMNVPEINDSSFITLSGARHPLLMLLGKDNTIKEIVPLNLQLGGRDSVMIITGPNAGGKTIAIKTVGLLLSMALSGIPVPCDSSSTFPFVNEILVDMGDEQSIESSLSTFSAHIANITMILKKADSKSIVLIDELGTGTDPAQGAAIACAVMHDLKEKGALVFATTHLIDIVGFVHRTEGMLNASMEFDDETLSPLYRLKVGEPGQSYALEIAKRFGMPEETIISAKGMLGSMKVEFHNLITDMKVKRIQYEEELAKLEKQRRGMELKEIILKETLIETENQRREILKNAYEEARNFISEAKREINAILEETKREKKRESQKKLAATEQKVETALKGYVQEPTLSIEEIKEGSIVFVKSIGYDAEVIGIDRRRHHLRVKMGSKEIEVPITDVSQGIGKYPEKRELDYSYDKAEEMVPVELNIIGTRVDEALSRLEPFLNHASIENLKEIIIIHGIGTGALLKAVRNYLKGHPLVRDFRKGELSEGGNGVTIVKMK